MLYYVLFLDEVSFCPCAKFESLIAHFLLLRLFRNLTYVKKIVFFLLNPTSLVYNVRLRVQKVT